MNANFCSIDLRGMYSAGHPRVAFTSADMAASGTIPFAMVHYEASLETKHLPSTLRLDLGKQTFLDNIDEPSLQEAAVTLSRYLGAILMKSPEISAAKPIAAPAPAAAAAW